MKTLREILATKAHDNTWVAIYDEYTTMKDGRPVRQLKYRVVNIEDYKRLARGEKLRVNRDNGNLETYQDKNPHKVRELGRAHDRAEARKFLPKK